MSWLTLTDCVDHDILLHLLESQFGLSSSALCWIASLLSSWSCNIHLKARTSRIYNILFGVPQGSILGSLLFILYTSNITNIASRLGIIIHFYADDTQLYIKLSTKDITTAKNKLVNCIHEIQAWCASMRLKLNASNTQLIWFDRNAKRSIEIIDLNLDVDANYIIHPAAVVRDLGVLLDSSYRCPITSPLWLRLATFISVGFVKSSNPSMKNVNVWWCRL